MVEIIPTSDLRIERDLHPEMGEVIITRSREAMTTEVVVLPDETPEMAEAIAESEMIRVCEKILDPEIEQVDRKTIPEIERALLRVEVRIPK